MGFNPFIYKYNIKLLLFKLNYFDFDYKIIEKLSLHFIENNF